MPEDTFPKNMYHDTFGVIEVDSQATMELALSRGFKRVPPPLSTIPKLEARIVEVTAELKDLKENLVAKKHEAEVAMKAEEILEKMRAETAKKDAEAQEAAEKQAAKDAHDAEKKAEADAKALAKEAVATEKAEAKEADQAAKIAEHLKGAKK